MNKQEYRSMVEDELNDPGYSYMSKDNKDIILKFHDLLVDVMTDEKLAPVFIGMFKSESFSIPREVVKDDELEKLEDFESTTVNYDILDDGEFHIIYDKMSNKWFFDRTYDFLEYAKEICAFLGISVDDAEVSAFDDYKRSKPYKLLNGATSTTLGLDDFIIILEELKSKGNLDGLANKGIPMTKLTEKLDNYFNS